MVLAEQLEGVQGLAVGVELPGGGVDLRTRVSVTFHMSRVGEVTCVPLHRVQSLL